MDILPFSNYCTACVPQLEFILPMSDENVTGTYGKFHVNKVANSEREVASVRTAFGFYTGQGSDI